MEVRNCRFKYQCPNDWSALDRTDKSNVRFCHQCNENVYFCSSSEELREALVNDYCVAIEVPKERQGDQKMMLGVADSDALF